jgi:hypothetical protein
MPTELLPMHIPACTWLRGLHHDHVHHVHLGQCTWALHDAATAERQLLKWTFQAKKRFFLITSNADTETNKPFCLVVMATEHPLLCI